MEGLAFAAMLSTVMPGLIAGLIAGWRGGVTTAVVSAIAGGILGFGCSVMLPAMLRPIGLGSAIDDTMPFSVFVFSIVGGLIAAWIVGRVVRR